MLIALGAAAALAQGDAADPYISSHNLKGVHPFGSHQFDAIDSVNLGTGGVDVSIPVYRRAGRGLDSSLTMVYSSKIWKAERTFSDPPPHLLAYMPSPFAGFTIRRGFGALAWREDDHDCPSGSPPYPPVRVFSNFVYTTADGATVRFPNRMVRSLPPENDPDAFCLEESSLQETPGTSESRVMLLHTPNEGDFEVVFKDGSREQLSSVTGFAVRRTDPNGNILEPFSDTLGRTGFFDSDGNALNNLPLFGVVAVTPQGTFPGGVCGPDQIVTEHRPLTLVGGVSLPNGLSYAFQWDPDFLELTRIDLPSGGYIRYEYQTLPYFDPPYEFSNLLTCGLHSRRVVLRAVSADGVSEDVWTYAYTSGNPEPLVRTTAVTDPEGNVSIHYFDEAGREELRAERYDDVGNLLERVDRQWHSYFAQVSSRNTTSDDDDPDPEMGFLEYGERGVRVLSTRTERQGRVELMETDWDSYTVSGIGHAFTDTRMNRVEERSFDWGPGEPGALLRRLQYEWLHDSSSAHRDRHIWDRMTAQTVMGSEGTVARAEFAYDGRSLTSTGGTVVQHDYAGYGPAMNIRGNPTKRRDWLDTENRWLETVNDYDDVGNLIKTVNPRGKQTLFSYTDSWTGINCASGQTRAFLTATTNAYGHLASRSNFSCSSLTASVTDPNGRTTSFGYDVMDRLKSVSAPDGGQHLRFYSDLDLGMTHQGQPVFRDAGVLPLRSKSFTSIEAGLWKGDLTVLDGLGRIRLAAMRNGGFPGFEQWDFVQTGYDGKGRRAFVSNPLSLFSASDYPSQFFPDKSHTFYDALDRVISIEAQDGQVSSIDYEGDQRTATDQAGASRRIREDGLGRIVQVREPAPFTGDLDSGDFSDSFYFYDPLDNLTLVQQGPGDDGDGAGGTVQSRGFVYDSLSRPIQESHPESGTTAYSYDDQGNLKQRIDARGRITHHVYDDLDRMTSTSYQSGDPERVEATPPVNYFWDGATLQNLKGRLRQVTDGAGSSFFQYDSMGRVSHSVRTTLGKTLTADYSWTQLGGIKTASYAETNPAGYTLIWDYDEQGRQIGLRDGLGNPFVSGRQLVHDPTFGFSEQVFYPNGIVERMDYNSRLQPRHREARRSSGQYLMSLDYDFYGFANADNGNIRAVHDLTDPSRDRLYTYDALNRLTGVLGNPWSIAYEYDRFGNRLASEGTPSTPNFVDSLTMADPSTNRIVGWEYDLAGNLLDDGSHHLVWDAAGRMIAMGPSTAGSPPPLNDGRSSRGERRTGLKPRTSFQPAATYLYDYQDRRAVKVIGSSGRVYFWDEAIGEVIWEFPTGPGTQDVVRGWLDGRLVLENDTRPGGGLVYFFRDHLGSTQVTADYFTGAPVCSSYFHPFGQSADSSGCDVHTRKFTTKERDTESGLDYFGVRYYDSVMGRFSSPDPLLASANLKNPQSWNRYAYVLGNPVRLVDPDGSQQLDPLTWEVFIGGGSTVLPLILRDPATALLVGGTAVAVLVTMYPEETKQVATAVAESIGLMENTNDAGTPAVNGDNEEEDYVDLTTPERRKHILEGDEHGGGHRHGTGKPGKSEFPESWSDDKIIDAISDVATDPASVRTPGRNGRTIVSGTRDGIDIEVIVESDGSIVTGYPTNAPRNPR